MLIINLEAEFPRAIAEVQNWVEFGDIKVKEDIVVGLENCPQVLNGLFTGKNFGKQLVKL